MLKKSISHLILSIVKEKKKEVKALRQNISLGEEPPVIADYL